MKSIGTIASIAARQAEIVFLLDSPLRFSSPRKWLRDVDIALGRSIEIENKFKEFRAEADKLDELAASVRTEKKLKRAKSLPA